MGNSSSGRNSEASTEAETKLDRGLHSYWLQIYSDLADLASDGEECESNSHDKKLVATSMHEETQRETIKERFVDLFGGASEYLGETLFLYFFKNESFTQSTFIAAMETMKEGIVDNRDLVTFLWHIFPMQEQVRSPDMMSLLRAAAISALTIGYHGDIAPENMSSTLLEGLSASLICCHGDSIEKTCSRVQRWVSVNCPRLFLGLKLWLSGILQPLSSASEGVLPVYQLPSVPSPDLKLLVWLLSCSLPKCFLGHKTGSKSEQSCDFPVGGTWTKLYSSSDHGLSVNRFKHHCYDYRCPSVLILECRATPTIMTTPTSEDPSTDGHTSLVQLAIALDTEWRDGTYFYGGDNFKLLQLKPTFDVLASGAKLLSLNEKQRGFPTGLRVRTSERDSLCVLEVKESLESARVRGGEWMSIRSLTMWGCGDVEALESQQKMKDWTQKEIARRRQINRRQLRANWMDSPDRAILDMGGVKTDRPTERPE